MNAVHFTGRCERCQHLFADEHRDHRRPYHHGDLRNALVVAATELAARDGPDGVVLREAARRIGVSPSAAYRHFPSREGLLAVVGSQARRALAARMFAAMDAIRRVW